MWVVTLITGWLPSPVHDASRAILRFQFRLNAYIFLLVPTYPSQLFGDSQSSATPGGGAVATPPGVGGGVGGVAVPQEPAWSLFLGKGAKRVLVLIIVLGVPAYVGSVVFRFTAQDHLQLLVQNNELAGSMNQYVASADQCRTATNPVSCQENVDRVFSQQLQAFVDNVRGTSASGISQSVIVEVTTDASNAQIVTAQLADAGPTLADYQNAYRRTNAANVLEQLVSGQTQLKNALNATLFG